MSARVGEGAAVAAADHTNLEDVLNGTGSVASTVTDGAAKALDVATEHMGIGNMLLESEVTQSRPKMERHDYSDDDLYASTALKMGDDYGSHGAHLAMRGADVASRAVVRQINNNRAVTVILGLASGALVLGAIEKLVCKAFTGKSFSEQKAHFSAAYFEFVTLAINSAVRLGFLAVGAAFALASKIGGLAIGGTVALLSLLSVDAYRGVRNHVEFHSPVSFHGESRGIYGGENTSGDLVDNRRHGGEYSGVFTEDLMRSPAAND